MKTVPIPISLLVALVLAATLAAGVQVTTIVQMGDGHTTTTQTSSDRANGPEDKQ